MERKISKKVREQKAITLIVLVITIIVLLILVGVSIATLTGENGVLSRAKTAVEKNQEAELEEKDRLSSYENAMDNWMNTNRDDNSDSKKELEQLKAILNQTNATAEDIALGKKAYSKGYFQ